MKLNPNLLLRRAFLPGKTHDNVGENEEMAATSTAITRHSSHEVTTRHTSHPKTIEKRLSYAMTTVKDAIVSPMWHHPKKCQDHHHQVSSTHASTASSTEIPPAKPTVEESRQSADYTPSGEAISTTVNSSITSPSSFKAFSQRIMPPRVCRKVSTRTTEEGQAEVILGSFNRTGSERMAEFLNNELQQQHQQAKQDYTIRLLRGKHLTHRPLSSINEEREVNISTSTAGTSLLIDCMNNQQWTSIVDMPVQADDTLWGGPLYTFHFQASPEDTVVFSLLDDQEEEVANTHISIQEHLQSLQNYQEGLNINQWLTLTGVDSKDHQNPMAPQIEIRLTTNTSSATLQPQESCPILAPGPALPPMMTSYVARKEILVAQAPVILNVYDVSHSERICTLNDYLKPLGAGGIFHAAIQVHGKEYSFGGTRDRRHKGTGVFACAPKQCPVHHYKESIYLGDCELSPAQVQGIVQGMEPKWLAQDYNLFHKNCCFFSQELAIELGLGDIPSWVYSLAQNAQGMEPQILKINSYVIEFQKHRSGATQTKSNAATTDIPQPNQPPSACKQSKNSHEDKEEEHATDVMLDHVMAARIQRSFRARKRQYQTSN